jgi:uncharacterized membrane protein YgcG
MRRLSLIPLALAAVAVPVLLALGVHFAAGSSLTAPPAVVARVSTAPIATPSVAPTTSTTRTTTTSDRCAEPEHRNDPRCAARPDDKSGRKSGSDDNSGSGSSGSGKGRSGSGRSGGDD